MKKYLVTILVLLSMLIIQVSTVAAAPMASGTVSLVSVSHGFKGPIFTFTVSGDFSKKELKGTVHVQGGADYGLHCAQKDDTTVTCTTSDKVSGVNVSVTFGGSTFWTYVPEAPTLTPDLAPTEYCYSIWDWWDFTDNEWTDFGPYCQDTPAEEGDIIFYTVPDPNGSFEFPSMFLEENIFEGYCDAWAGSAYYYPGCPDEPF